MGKPTNKPRVKGNLKPASSAIPATTAGIVSSSRPSTPSSFDGHDSPSSLTAADLDPELVFILKKLSKRDVVTKLKALEDLQAYLQNNEKAIDAILHSWIGIYNKMTLEVDRRVRLVANEIHGLMTVHAKKKLAPVLKDLIGPWLLSMFDQSKDIMQVARSAFETVFIPEKRLPAISFCQKKILQYNSDMLLYKTADTLSDPRYVSKEDMMAKYARIVSSSFQVLAYLITSLSVEERDKCQSDYTIILDDTTMWKKFSTHENGLIRKALYGFIKTLLLSWPDMIERRMNLICPSLFGSVFKEKDSATHSNMWDAVLLMTKKFPSSWIIIGEKKPALPKLYNFLRCGLHGSPNIAYPSLLALLANLPPELKSTPNFYKDIFENFWKGLSTEYVDRSNSHIFLNAYAECIVYFVMTLSKSNEESAAGIANYLILNTFWDMVKIYFLNSSDKVINDKLDPNTGYAIIAKHFAVLASVDNSIVEDCLSTLYFNFDELFVQTIVDCDSSTTRAPLDMDIFCQKISNFLTAISHELTNIIIKHNGGKGKSLAQFVEGSVQRLLVASVESSIVHGGHSTSLLKMANQLIHADNMVFPEESLNKLLQANKQLLDSLVGNVFEKSLAYSTTYYIAFIARLKKDNNKTAEANDLWLNLVAKLNNMYQNNDDSIVMKGAFILGVVWKQIMAEKLALSEEDCSEALENIIRISLYKLNDGNINDSLRQVLESTLSSTLGYYSSSHFPSITTASMTIETIKAKLNTFNQHHYVDKKSSAITKPTVAVLYSTLSALKILSGAIEVTVNDKKETLQLLLKCDTSNELCAEIFDAISTASNFKASVLVEEDEMKEEVELLANIFDQASSIWHSIIEVGLLQEAQQQQLKPLLDRVRKSISNVYYAASPSDSVQRIKNLVTAATIDTSTWTALLGTEKEWIQLASRTFNQQYTADYLQLGIRNSYSIASSEILVDNADELIPIKYDIYGLSAFGRLVLTWAEYFATAAAEDVNSIMNNMNYDWVIRQLMLASISCEQGLTVSDISRTIFSSKATKGIRNFVENISQQVFSEWLMSVSSSIVDINAWNDQLLQSVTAKQIDISNDRLISFIAHLISQKQADAKNNSRFMVVESAILLQWILQKLVILGDWPVEQMERWLPLIRAESDELDLLVKLAILNALKNRMNQSNAYQHYQSDLASKLSGITQGLDQFDFCIEEYDSRKKLNWNLLCLLNASASKTSGFDIPRQRLMFLVQTLRPLLASDSSNQGEEFSNELQKAKILTQMAQLLKHMTISIADVQGSHWDWFLQCCFEWTAFKDTAAQPEELLLVYHALDLYHTLYDMSMIGQEEYTIVQNEELHDTAKEHLRAMSKSLLQLMAMEQEYMKKLKNNDIETHIALNNKKARITYQALLSGLLEHIPENVLFDDEYFSSFNALIRIPNEVLQKRAYSLLKKYISFKTQELSVQLEFTETSEEETQVNIHDDILSILLNPPEIASEGILEIEGPEYSNNVLAYLLTWMLMLDHFTDITFKLKQEYTNQLKEKEAVSHLMPLLCKILNVGINSSNTKKAFDLSLWSVSEYDVEGFDASIETSFFVLAGHLYYRTLVHIPSLVRQWWIDCKNRQITIAVENYTEKYFSQQLIQRELELVNHPDIKNQLEENEENEFSIKTLKGANEVTATYKVDEQNMQIAIKLPSNFPLRHIDVESIQKVGVNDKQWRGWMFAVASVISSQVRTTFSFVL
ncbi:hypothetical protein BDF20DRAFT_813891 [Mycotypha africana]|uniref:uncharacterized protein n=1 Tax=Mycotypha africana TaxID=64632 RepID=UPI00230180B7|nr:uncharacterized protein BDF20DRAFT_813891 [Mycotypha africana]KAI8988239.1 hypothetical protein BDF20DRAFT_813891 [Mycotypha africana]